LSLRSSGFLTSSALLVKHEGIDMAEDKTTQEKMDELSQEQPNPDAWKRFVWEEGDIIIHPRNEGDGKAK
jgi:hypothetical protein